MIGSVLRRLYVMAMPALVVGGVWALGWVNALDSRFADLISPAQPELVERACNAAYPVSPSPVSRS
jgi:hypothetical protein